jgi:hypothetical protein
MGKHPGYRKWGLHLYLLLQKFFDQRNQMALESFSQISKNSTAAIYSSDKLPIGEVDKNTNESGTCPLYLAAVYLWYFPTFPVRNSYNFVDTVLL